MTNAAREGLELVPAIDLLGGRIVRLKQGRYDEVTVYSDDPLGQVQAFEADGATRIHVVDLDGARDGTPGNVAVLERIARAARVELQVGGGIRTESDIARWRDAGVARVVVGTRAAMDPDFAARAAADWPGGLVVAVDAKDGEVMVRGWVDAAGVRAVDLAKRLDAVGVAGFLFTNIARDGMGTGPDVEGTRALQQEVKATVIASGGIGAVSHLLALQEAGLREAVCGRALYEGAFGYAEARRALREACAAAKGTGAPC